MIYWNNLAFLNSNSWYYSFRISLDITRFRVEYVFQSVNKHVKT